MRKWGEGTFRRSHSWEGMEQIQGSDAWSICLSGKSKTPKPPVPDSRWDWERKMNRNAQILHLPLNFVVAFAQKYVGEAKEISPVRSESYTQRKSFWSYPHLLPRSAPLQEVSAVPHGQDLECDSQGRGGPGSHHGQRQPAGVRNPLQGDSSPYCKMEVARPIPWEQHLKSSVVWSKHVCSQNSMRGSPA